MDKAQLKNILENSYDKKQWGSVLNQFFGVMMLFERKVTELPKNDIVEFAYEIANFTTADGRLIGVFEIHVLPKVRLEQKRVSLRNLLKKISREVVDGILVVFVQDKKWRFSFVSDISSKSTEPKRYTYLLGEGENCRTACDRFFELNGKKLKLDDFYEAFSVEKLNKDFFKGYYSFYAKFCAHLAANPQYRKSLLGNEDNLSNSWKGADAKTLRDFTKRLLGRLVFLHFIQKKGWLGVDVNSYEWVGGDKRFLQNLFATFEDKNVFYSSVLNILFFNTLNVQNRTKNLANSILGKNIKIPYLNGGLFEPDTLDLKPIDFPAQFFEELFAFFDVFNFTIDENDPLDCEVGIDPEMLGHIFESLLEDNQSELGAFYTPKNIVKYLCQESLCQYLTTNMLHTNPHDIKTLVYSHLAVGDLVQKENAKLANDLLIKVRICDPAIGSAAFPMGMLKEIFDCRHALFSFLSKSQNFVPVEIKKQIIQNCIYGVDVDSGAIEIARLRFWLALVVEENEPQPLPNLDFKIMQGNSLIETFANYDLSVLLNGNGEDDEVVLREKQMLLGEGFGSNTVQISVFDQYAKKDLQELLRKYFDLDAYAKKSGEKLNKQILKEEINSFIEKKIGKHINAKIRDFSVKIEKIDREWLEKGINDTNINKNSKEYKEYLLLIHLRNEAKNIEKKIVEFEKKNNRPFFLWKLWFKEVFDEGGFDIVIGNPPYIQLQKMPHLQKELEAQNFDTFNKMSDIYTLFYEKGMRLLKEKGTLAFITSNKWMRANYGEALRKFLVEKTNPLFLLDFGNIQVFESATVDTNVLFLQNKRNEHKLKAVRLDKKMDISSGLDKVFNDNAYILPALNENAWVVGEKDVFDIKAKVEKQGKPLKEWNITINYGIKTGLNEAFIIDEKTKNKLIAEDEKSAEIIKPILRGRDIDKWYPDFQNLYIIGTFPSLKINIENYPAIKKHLELFGKEKLVQDGTGRKKTTNKWFETQDQINYYQDFSKPKIIYPDITQHFQFCYEENTAYTNNTIYIMTGEHLKYLTCFFNSILFKYCFMDNFTDLGGKGRRLFSVFMNKIPVKPVDSSTEVLFNHLVDYLVFLSKRIQRLKKESQNYDKELLMKMLFDEINDGLIMEMYLSDEFEKYNTQLKCYLSDMPAITTEDEENTFKKLASYYDVIAHYTHKVQGSLSKITTIPIIHLIYNTIRF